MAHTIVKCGFIDQQMPLRGQICVVKVHDSITNKHKFRIRYLDSARHGNDMQEDAVAAAKTGSIIPETAGAVLLDNIGDSCFYPVE